MQSIRTFLLISGCVFLPKYQFAQMSCTNLGQNPSTAFPVCGTAVFSQDSVPVCGGRIIPCPCPVTGTYQPFTDKNPFWYKFTCFRGGTLGFTITPHHLDEDYDWQIFDVTGRNPADVFTDSTLFVACNWSYDHGVTGAAAPPLGNSLVECEGPGVPLFSSMPTLIIGHNYLLLVSHFSDSQSGYSLSFGGGGAVITDTAAPHLKSASASCDGTKAYLKLNKKMKCNSLSADGSEFMFTPPLASVVMAAGAGCTVGFEMDSLTLALSNPLPPGNYTLHIKNGIDGNTITDNCGAAIPSGENIMVTVYPNVPVAMDSIVPVKCAPATLQLVFKKGIQCSSVAADGSDFVVTGPSSVTVSNADAGCSYGLTKSIKVQLSAPIFSAGTYQLKLVRGSDGNTLINECLLETPAGSTINFYTSDTVNADYSYSIRYGCHNDTVDYFHSGRNGVNSWIWNFDNQIAVNVQNPSFIYHSFGPKQTQLTVSNGVCTDTSSFKTVKLDNVLHADFESGLMVCPGSPAIFKDNSTGNIISWNWKFGYGKMSNLPHPPPQVYPASAINTDVTVKLVVQNNAGCQDSTEQKISVAGNCLIIVPGAFTPNNDGLNDELYPLNAYKVFDLLFRVFDRFGQLLFETRDFNKRWNGSFKGQPADSGTYVWTLKYTSDVTGKTVTQSGSTVLIR